MRVALCAHDGHILRRNKQLTLPEQGADTVVNRLGDAILAVLPSDQSCVGLGVGTPGSVDPYTGTVLYASNLMWNNVPLADKLTARLNLPVVLGNDANLAALGEHRYGAGRGTRDMVYVTISTGVGCGVILDNSLVLGHPGMAPELGHIVMDVNAPPSASGVPGGFEEMVSGTAIARMARQHLRAGRASIMPDLAGDDTDRVTAKEVSRAAQMGDVLAKEIICQVARNIGLGLVNALHLFDPERIVLGGSVTLMGDLLFDGVRETVKRYAMAPYRDRPIVLAELGDDCGLLGAAALAWQMANDFRQNSRKAAKTLRFSLYGFARDSSCYE